MNGLTLIKCSCSKLVFNVYDYFISVSERLSTVQTNSLVLERIGRRLEQVKIIRTQSHIWSLKLIDDEIWCCQGDGVLVYGTTLTLVRRINTGSAHDVALLPRENVVIAGLELCEMSKSGTEINLLKMFITVQ